MQKEEQTETVTVPKRDWDRLNEQVQALRQENKQLRRKLLKNHSSYSVLMKKTSAVHSPKDMTLSIKQVIPQQVNIREKFRSEMSDWSKRMAAKKIMMKLAPIEIKEQRNKEDVIMNQIDAQQLNLLNLNQNSQRSASPSKNQQISSPTKPFDVKQSNKEIFLSNAIQDELKLIQNICLFGPTEQDLRQQFQQGKIHTNVQLIYSLHPQLGPKYIQYGHQLYPLEGVPTRRLKTQETAACTNKIIFRKNAKRTDCSLLIFEAEQGNEKIHMKNQLLNKVNPIKRLVNFYFQFNDFFYFETEEQKLNNLSPNKSMEDTKNRQSGQSVEAQQSTRSKKETKTQKYCVKSSYCLCIFTYYPFINVMEQVVNCLMDQIKIRRVEAYAKQGQLEKVSIRYLIAELHQISTELFNQISSIPMQLGQQVALTVGHFKILFNFAEQKIDYLLYDGWVFDILKIFSKETVYDILTNIMTEQSICFVCQNLKLLTEVVFLFITVLSRPFQYPHPCISRIMSYDYLDSPFVITLGLNQSTKWVEQNAKYYEKKIFVDLNGVEAKIYNNKKAKSIKSEKLKKIFSSFYKKLQNSSPLNQFFKKKETIIRPASREQNEQVVKLIEKIQQYYNQQIFFHLPNQQIISTIKQSSPELNEHCKITTILKEIQRYVKQSRKPSEKDNFVEQLVEQQIFYMYISQHYGLK